MARRLTENAYRLARLCLRVILEPEDHRLSLAVRAVPFTFVEARRL